MRAALPLYVYPSAGETNWASAINAGGSKVSFIIANVNSGPGTSPQSDWTAVINNAVANGIAIYGYVYSQYGARPGAAVDADVSAWFQYYPNITGIFVDETSSDLSQLSYYQARYNYIKGLNSANRVVINPGTITDESFMSVCDVNTIFESDYATWLGRSFPAWMANYSSDRFYAIVYATLSEADMNQVISAAQTHNFGNVFVTDALTPSAPLPSYFDGELNSIVAQNTAVTAAPVITGTSVSHVTTSSATVSWSTAAASLGSVLYGTSAGALSPKTDGLLSANHAVTLSGLARRTAYYYQISAQSADGTATTLSAIGTFRTK